MNPWMMPPLKAIRRLDPVAIRRVPHRIAAVATAMLLTLAACGGDDPTAAPEAADRAAPPANATPAHTPAATPAADAGENSDATGEPAAPETAPEAETAPATEPARPPALPAAYERANVPFTNHLSLPVPSGWELTSDDPFTNDYRDPTGQVLLRVRFDPDARQDRAYVVLEREMREMADTWQGFRFIEQEWYHCCQQDIRPDITAAEAEFTFTLDGATRHALQRAVVYPDLGHVTVYLSAPEEQFATMEPVADRAIELTLAG